MGKNQFWQNKKGNLSARTARSSPVLSRASPLHLLHLPYFLQSNNQTFALTCPDGPVWRSDHQGSQGDQASREVQSLSSGSAWYPGYFGLRIRCACSPSPPPLSIRGSWSRPQALPHQVQLPVKEALLVLLGLRYGQPLQDRKFEMNLKIYEADQFARWFKDKHRPGSDVCDHPVTRGWTYSH